MEGGLDVAPFVTLNSADDIQYDDNHVPFHHLARKKGKTYDVNTVRQIQIIYIIAAVLWIVIIFIFRWYQTGILGLVFLAIPLIVFAFNYHFACLSTTDLEQEMFQGNFLSFGFLITIILINWTKVGDKSKLFKILMTALILIMLSLIDIWVSKDKLILIKHIRTVLQTSALILLAYALYVYYFDAVETNLDSHI